MISLLLPLFRAGVYNRRVQSAQGIWRRAPRMAVHEIQSESCSLKLLHEIINSVSGRAWWKEILDRQFQHFGEIE